VPCQWQSADKQRLFGIAKQGANDLRRNLVLAGHSLLTMVMRMPEPPSDRLLLWARRLAARKNRNVAAACAPCANCRMFGSPARRPRQ
jgi:hypothetical protein